jgi:uncharacterized protein
MKAKEIIGRIAEKKRLSSILESTEPEFLSVYGRRRIGKTFLIREFFRDQIVFDFSGSKDAALNVQLENFHKEFLLRTKGKLQTAVPKSWSEALDYLATYLRSFSNKKGKIVVFLDEMPWLDTPKSGFVSALEFFWNQHVSKMNQVVLVACGSASSWIRKNLINARGGLYNRVTQRMRLSPFTLAETEQFLLKEKIRLPRFQILELYMALGGVPFYLKYISRGLSATQIIDTLCFRKESPLKDEYKQLYSSIFKNAEMHEKIVEILASKPQGLGRTEIQILTKIPQATLSRTLEELVECDFLQVFQGYRKKKKDSIYRLVDNFSLFYAKFMRDQNLMHSGLWQAYSKEPSYKAWTGYAFENICTQHLTQILQAMEIKGIHVNAFSWKAEAKDGLPGAQADLIIDRADKIINLCEAKFSFNNYLITKDYAQTLRLRNSVFNHSTKTKKAVFNILITPFPAVKNEYYLEQIQNEINIDALFNE